MQLHDYNMPHKSRQPSPIQRLRSITAGKIGQESTGTFAFRYDGGGARPILESEEKAKPDRSRAIRTGPLNKPRKVNSPATRRSGLRRIAAEKSVIADYPRSTAQGVPDPPALTLK